MIAAACAKASRAGHLPRHVERRGQAQWLAPHLLPQRLALDKLADDVMSAIRFANFVNGCLLYTSPSPRDS